MSKKEMSEAVRVLKEGRDVVHPRKSAEWVGAPGESEGAGVAGVVVESDPGADRDRVAALDIPPDRYLEVAQDVGVSERTVRRWVKGESSPSPLARAALEKAGWL